MERVTRRTKIIATIGPVSSSLAMIERLLEAGVDIFRLNFSHGTQREKEEVIGTIRELSSRSSRPIGILADLQGPKIRTRKMEGGGVLLTKGERVTITTEDIIGRPGLISTTYRELPHDVRPGSTILLDDGMLTLRALSSNDTTVECEVVEGGLLKDNKGINLPGVQVSAPSLTPKDREDLKFCLDAGVDYIALSFVRTASDLDDLKRLIAEEGKAIPVVAKIEKPEALKNLRLVVTAADAIMVARGDLGVELSPERVPLMQKEIIRLCNEMGKPVITATQMLESMIVHSRPTRAETSDVANAILDGTDAVMLSGETASGNYPVEAVETMVKVALDVEQSDLWRKHQQVQPKGGDIAEAVAEAACNTASMLDAKAIVVFTQSGSTAALISKFRPSQTIIAFTPFPEIQRRLALYWGVSSHPVGSMRNTDDQIRAVEETLYAGGFTKGSLVVITMGVPLAARGSTNLMKVHRIGDIGFYAGNSQ